MNGSTTVLVCLVFSVIQLGRAAMTFDKYGQQEMSANIRADLKSQRKLSRQRRYLEFPEGSSLQFVYDVVVAVVDNVNYISVSITVALAYELPSEPPSELLEDLRDRLKDGTFGIARNDTESQITYVDVTPNYQIREAYRHQTAPYDAVVGHSYTQQGERIVNPKYSSRARNPLYHYVHASKKQKYSPIETKYPRRRLINALPEEGRPRSESMNVIPVYLPFERQRPLDHNIHHILGKRRTNTRPRRSDSADEKVDRIHIRHHRKTRHAFFNAIEKYLDRKNLKGHFCVLRAICETARKSEQEREPGSFVGELMRSIFTIPEPFDDELHDKQRDYKEHQYDAAQSVKGDCSDYYQHCKHSLWSSGFVS